MIKHILESEVRNALGNIALEVDLKKVEVTKSLNFGDYTTNIALIAAKQLGKTPRELAEGILKALQESPTGVRYIKNIEIAGPGFINMSVQEDVLIEEVRAIQDELAGGFPFLKHEKANIEFISANPTGDLHIGHGRGAFYGDVLSRILTYAGANIEKEFYINDSRESNQIVELGKTALGKGEQYKTEKLSSIIEDLKDELKNIAEQYNTATPGRWVTKGYQEAGFLLGEKVGVHNRKFIEEKLHIPFDTWFSEDKSLRAARRNEKILELLKEKKLVYEKDGALWLKTSEYGDDEDRVVVRSDGTKSYFLSDISYHGDKFARGYTKVIDIWGADHHGHVKRMMAVKRMLGWEGEFQIFITQLVALKEGGERKKMSKRAGTVILLEDLVDELGIDVVRWFFIEKSLNTHMDFDLALAREQSAKNPVYYVQYAHARMSSIIQKSAELKGDDTTLKDILENNSARKLAVKLVAFPEVIEEISKDYQVHKLTTYAYELASEFSQFYRDVKIIEDDVYHKGAYELMNHTRDVLAKSLGLLGISAPQNM